MSSSPNSPSSSSAPTSASSRATSSSRAASSATSSSGATSTATMATRDSLVVSEVFGPTIQGEGPYTGRQVGFIRFGGCNLHCSWCDTPYTWDASRYDLRAELGRRTVDSLMDHIEAMDVDTVVLSGGEPLLQQKQPAWGRLLHDLAALGVQIHVETNGTLAPTDTTRSYIDHYSVSPKLAHAGDPEEDRIVGEVLATYRDIAEDGGAVFKFVARTRRDLLDIGVLARAHQLNHHHVWVMPEGTTDEEILAGTRDLIEDTLAAGYNFTTRLHTLVWGQERAR